MSPDLTPLLRMRRHVRVAHHVPGRIRLKLAGRALSELRGFDPAPFAGLLDGIEAVRSVRVNRAALSAAVEYDPRLMPAKDWAALLEGTSEEVAAVLARIRPADGAGDDIRRMRIHVE